MPTVDDEIADAERRLGVRFARPELLRRALTHASRRSETQPCNERLEFLGDTILGAVVAEHLFRELPGDDEGRLTRIKSEVVSTRALAAATDALGIAPLIRASLGPGEKLSARLRAGVFEALVAAIDLDQGRAAAAAFVLEQLGGEIDRRIAGRGTRDYKSRLQRHAQQTMQATPTYELVERRGPSHAATFTVCACIDDERFPSACGRSKKDAEQQAARLALDALGASYDDHAS